MRNKFAGFLPVWQTNGPGFRRPGRRHVYPLVLQMPSISSCTSA